RLRDPVVSDRERPVRRRLARTRRPAHAQSGLPRAGLPRPVAHAVLGVDSTSHASGTHVHAVEDGTQWEEGLTGGPLYKNGLVHPGMLRTTARASTTIEPSMYPWWINASRRKTSPPGRLVMATSKITQNPTAKATAPDRRRLPQANARHRV